MTFSEPTAPKNTGNTVLVGSPGPFSASVFKVLISRGIPVSHVVCSGVAPAEPVERALPVTTPDQDESLDVLATRYHIPLNHVSQPSDLLSPDLVLPENPDYILVACFPFRIPRPIINLPRIACLNIHPSLLPKYRGPDPIFWQLKKGEPDTGVSLHLVTENFDDGPIVKQQVSAYGDGSYKKDIEILLGQAGADLFSTLTTEDLSVNEVARAQDESASSYFPSPLGNDYRLSTDWSARQAFNFIRGTWPPIDKHRIDINGTTWTITQALEYVSENKFAESEHKNQEELYIPFSPGILRALGHKA